MGKAIRFVGLDVHASSIAVAVAESGRGGEVRSLGTIPNRPESIRKLFSISRLAEPELEAGWFHEMIPQTIPSKYQKVALLHIDSDLYPSAKQVLCGVEPILQDGTLVCFDDWFMYRGNPNQGEQRAFREFLDEHPNWQAIPYQTYSVFCNSFILHRK